MIQSKFQTIHLDSNPRFTMKTITSTIVVVALTCCLTSGLMGQGGLSGGLGGPKKKDDKDANGKKWNEADPFDKDKKKPSASKPDGSTKPPKSPSQKPPSLDQRIDRLQKKHDKLQSKRNSTQIIDHIKSLDQAEKTAARYRDLIDRERQKRPKRNTWKGPGLPPPGKSGGNPEPWRDALLDELDAQWEQARKLIEEFKRKKLKPGSMAERVALNQINRELLDVYLTAMRLRLLELKWERELKQKPLKLQLKTKKATIDFVAWENQPMLDKLPRGGGGIVPKLKQIKKMMDMKYGNSSLLATLQIKVKAHLWSFGHRNYELAIDPTSSPAPHIPDGMRKKGQLRLEATSISHGFRDFVIPITPDHLQTIREKGFVDINLADVRPVRRARHWILVGANNVKIRIVAINHTPTNPPKPTSGDGDGSSNDGSTGNGSSNDGSNSDDGKDHSKENSDNKSDTDGKSDGKKSDSDSDSKGTGKKDKDSKGKSDQNDETGDDEDKDKSDSEVSYDSEKGKSGREKNSKPNTSDNQSDADDLLSSDANPNTKPKPSKKPAAKKPSPTKKRPSGNQGSSSSAKVSPGNWLTMKEVKTLPVRQVGGFWKDKLSGEVVWFQVAGKKLLVRAASDRKNTLGIDADQRGNSRRYFGEAYTVPKSGNCTKYGYWQPCALAISGGEASGEWRGKKTDEKTCKLGDEPDSGKLRFQRMQLVAFAPLAHGKLMHMTGSPAVGNQQSQFKATAKIGVQLDGTHASKVKITLNGVLLNSSDGGKTYDFITTRSGRHELKLEIIENDGGILHRENIRIDVPGIRGIGR